MALVLFTIFVRDMDSGIECSLSKFVGDTKPSNLVDTLERRDTIQKDLDRLERWACETSGSSTRSGARSCICVRAIPGWAMRELRGACGGGLGGVDG